MSVSSTPLSVQASQPLTQQEIRQLLASAKFSYAELIRVARSFPGYVHGEANDLLHDALGAALGTRACPSGVTIEKTLIEIMRSMSVVRTFGTTRGVD